jgi:hypothetical protein
MFENLVLRTVLGPIGQEITGGQRKLLSKEHHYLCYLPVINRMVTRKKTKSEEDVQFVKRNS